MAEGVGLISASGLHPCGAAFGSLCRFAALELRSHPITTGGGGGIDFGLRPPPLRGCLRQSVPLRVARTSEMLTRPTLGASALRAQLSVDLPREPQSLGSHPTTNGGGGGIRTHGAFQLSSFQDWRNRPLYHPSV